MCKQNSNPRFLKATKMTHLDKYYTPWATQEVYQNHVKRHASEHYRGHYLEEVRDAYYQLRDQQMGEFISDRRPATIKYLGVENNKHKYQVMIGSKPRILVVADDDWSVITYHKSN